MSGTMPVVPIAIVGVSAIMPEAPDAETFWTNLKSGRYSITDVPPERWDPELYYDPDPHAPDKTYSRIGGWVREFPWDPIGWKLPIPPKVAEQMDGGQRWALSCARSALTDAGWPNWDVDPERVAVILGNAIGGEKHYASNLRIEMPEVLRGLHASPTFAALPEQARAAILEETRKEFYASTFEITEDTMPGELANVMAGRIANLFDFRGPNFTTDAACASGLAAIWSASQGLASHQYDVALTGGVDRNMGVAAFVKFCKIGALSATGTRPFDAGADGFVMGEGAALFVLKRLEDAERVGDRIYAVLLGIAGSSDGKGKGITAPNPKGQRIAIERAWQQAGIDPATASALEAHGTSTRVGDASELESLTSVFGPAGAKPGSVALGSVKSNIGHLKAAAGAAGLFKLTMSLHNKVLVPSLHFGDPNPNVDWATSPFKVNTELRDWPTPESGVRRGAVSAFGFGGTNFHAVLEEYVPGRSDTQPKTFAAAEVPAREPQVVEPAPAAAPPRAIVVLAGGSDDEVVAQLRQVHADAAAGTTPPPFERDPALAHAAVRVAIDYGDATELAAKAEKLLKAFETGNAALFRMLRSQGVFIGRGPAPKVAFLYTGQGSQYVNMLKDLRASEPIVAQTFDEADAIMTPLLGRPLSSYIFIDAGDPAAVALLEQQLLQTEITQPAVLTSDLALTRLLADHHVRPDMVMGHSLGEYGALVAAGALDFHSALEAVSARGHEMASLTVEDNGAMAAVFGPLPEIERIVAEADGYVVVANVNSNSQAVVGGATAAVEKIIETFQAAGITAARIPVSHAFHTSIVAPASEPLKVALRRLNVRAPQLPIVANVTGEFYPEHADVETMLDILGKQVASPVQFVKGLHTLYAAGVRVYVEVGPKKALHGFVEDVLGSEHDDVLALFTNHPKFGDAISFNQALCGLYAAGLGLNGSTPVVEAPAIADVEVETPEPVRVDGWLPVVRPVTDAPVVITGAAVGLPGVPRVFDDENVGRLLSGQQFIESIPQKIREEMVDKHITRLVKPENGDPTFVPIDDVADVIKLAGRHAPIDLVAEFGVEEARDAALDEVTRLAIGAGIDALRDAGIPLVMHYRTTTLGTQLPDRWELPESLQDDTGVIFASAFPGFTSFAHDLRRYGEDRARRHELATLQAVRDKLAADSSAAADVDARITELERQLADDPFTFDRRFLFRVLSMGHSQFAELIGARGPNTQVNSACASTTVAMCIAEDWIRAGRCRRVVVVAADDVTSDELLPWVSSGFLASGAAATDENVADAAIPFDRRRHGMIIGTGAAAIVVESADAAAERGIRPICEIVAAVAANSAFHGTRLDLQHVSQTMEQLLRRAEARGIDRQAIAPNTLFVSHETYTPARGGSASAEINALRSTFGAAADEIVIANTKGYTGHAMGAGVEDILAIKSLETGIVPPVPNFREADPELGSLNLSKGGEYPVEYALRLAAGFGSQIAMAVLRRTPGPVAGRPAPDRLGFRYRIADPAVWRAWLAAVSGRPDPELEVVQHRLRVVDGKPAVAPEPEPESVQLNTPDVPAAVVTIVSELTGYPPELLDPELDLEADLGVDTVKQAEVFASVRAKFGIERDETLKLRDFPTLNHVIGWIESKIDTTPAAAPEPTSAPEQQPEPASVQLNTPDVRAAVVAIVSELTGYPTELLDPELDLEADLGVDTVKQAEVFASVRAKFDIERDETLKLRDFPTLNHVIGWIESKLDTTPEPTSAPEQQPEPASVQLNTPDVRAAVVEIVAELTGYPTELLDPDLDLEADLGVDTVKQAEVFASVRAKFGIERDETLKLRDFPTLNHVIGWIESKIAAKAEVGPAAAQHADEVAVERPTAPTPTVASDVNDECFPRRVPTPVLRAPAANWPHTNVTLDEGARVVVMLDEGGVGTALQARLAERNVTTLTLNAGIGTADLQDKVAEWLADGPITGVFWLPALDDEGPADKLDLATWRRALRRRVKNLYATMRASYEHAPFLVSATRLGGYFGYDEAGATAPLGGAVSGFTKAYHRELPDALVKVVDVPLEFPADRLADALVTEAEHDAGCVEVGHGLDGTRWTIALTEQPFGDTSTGLRLGADSVFVVTGAAGSIVSAITADLATASGGTFHLLDLTPKPDPEDPDLARFSTDKDGLKSELATRLKDAGERPTPVLIEKELARIERLAAALAAVRAIESAGGTAHYHQVDLTDADAVTAVVDAVRATSGHVDVLLHAAGLEISKTLPAKEAREYDLVFDVKTEGWFNLLHAAAELPIGATVVFSSVAGRFGNAGQTDYSAANDLLCKLTSNLRRTRPTIRGSAIDWTAWGGIGMATRGSIPKIMEMAGVEMLDPAVGVPWIRHELTAARTPGEVVVAGALGLLGAQPDSLPLTTTEPAPMIGAVTGEHGGLIVRTTLDPKEQPFLNDHRIDGIAVLPGVMGIEGFAEAARLFVPDWHVAGVEDVDFHAPLKFYRDEPRELVIRASARRDGTDVLVRCVLEAERVLAGSTEPQRTTHFTGTVRLSATAPQPEQDTAVVEPAETVGREQVYALYFHGPAYQVVAASWTDSDTAVGRFAADLPLNHTGNADVTAQPRLIELCFQTAGLWEAARNGRLALPLRVDKVRLVQRIPGGPLFAIARERDGGFDCTVQDATGHVVLRVDGYRTVALPGAVPDDIRRGLNPGLPQLSNA
jgi:acyl transferase domain-containing protein/NADP-dependent 3-hydroxy acid dehydrogenase YdfG/acyl carrier protein